MSALLKAGKRLLFAHEYGCVIVVTGTGLILVLDGYYYNPLLLYTIQHNRINRYYNYYNILVMVIVGSIIIGMVIEYYNK